MPQIEITAPATHPHCVALHLDPVFYDRLMFFAWDIDIFRILGRDGSQSGTWTIWIGCASELVAERMEPDWD